MNVARMKSKSRMKFTTKYTMYLGPKSYSIKVWSCTNEISFDTDDKLMQTYYKLTRPYLKWCAVHTISVNMWCTAGAFGVFDVSAFAPQPNKRRGKKEKLYVSCCGSDAFTMLHNLMSMEFHSIAESQQNWFGTSSSIAAVSSSP